MKKHVNGSESSVILQGSQPYAFSFYCFGVRGIPPGLPSAEQPELLLGLDAGVHSDTHLKSAASFTNKLCKLCATSEKAYKNGLFSFLHKQKNVCKLCEIWNIVHIMSRKLSKLSIKYLFSE